MPLSPCASQNHWVVCLLWRCTLTSWIWLSWRTCPTRSWLKFLLTLTRRPTTSPQQVRPAEKWYVYGFTINTDNVCERACVHVCVRASWTVFYIMLISNDFKCWVTPFRDSIAVSRYISLKVWLPFLHCSILSDSHVKLFYLQSVKKCQLGTPSFWKAVIKKTLFCWASCTIVY